MMSQITTDPPPTDANAPAQEKPLLFDAPGESSDLLGLSGETAPSTVSRLPGGLIVLLVVLLVAGGALYLMRMEGMEQARPDAGAVSAEQKIEQAIAGLIGHSPLPAAPAPALPDTQAVIARFANDPTDKQVRPDQLKKNPFAMRLPEAQQVAAVSPVSNKDQLRQRRLKQLRQEVDGYQLQTVMTGRTPMAVISGKVVREGEPMGNFRVAAIEQMSVVLSAEGNSYRLELKPISTNQTPTP